MKVAVIILNYNSSSDCEKCISYLKKQEGVELEIIIVDNASSPEDKENLRKLIKSPLTPVGGTQRIEGGLQGVTFIEAEKNSGYNAGNNIGLRYAAEKGYEYALIANPDMEFPDPLYISKLVKAITPPQPSPNREGAILEDRVLKSPPIGGDLEGAFPRGGELVGAPIVVVASDIVTPEGIHQNPMLPEGPWTSSFGWIKGFFKKPKNQDKYDFIGDYKTSHYCHKVSGCALMMDLSFIKDIGFFDEYPFLYCEEAILAKQVEKAGKKMYYVSDATAIHRHIKSEKGDPRPRFKQWNRSRQYFIKKYSDYPWYGRLFSSFSFNLYTILMFLAASLKR